MRLVLDSNIAFLFFSKDPFIRELVIKLELELISVPQLLLELRRNESKICDATKKSPEKFLRFIELLKDWIEFRQPDSRFISQAESLITHKNDVPFLALALELKIPIWSNDKHFKEQSKVLAFTVSELKELLI